MASSGRKKGSDLPNGAEVHKLSASQPLLVTTLSYYLVYCTVHQCVLSHTYVYIHTYNKASRLNLQIVVCVVGNLLKDPLYRTSSSYFF